MVVVVVVMFGVHLVIMWCLRQIKTRTRRR